MEKVRERLNEFLAIVDLSKRRFQEDIGVSPAYFANAVNGFSLRVQQKIKKAHPELNLEWLMTGKGNMFSEGYSADNNGKSDEGDSAYAESSFRDKNSKVAEKNDERLISIISSQQSSISKAQEQIDRLLDLLEKK